MKTDPVDGLPGLRLETAASVLLKETITAHMAQFGHVIGRDKAASKSTLSVYVDGLAGAMALTIAGGLCSRDELLGNIAEILREAVERDLQHLRKV
jgi:hypothetical protein